MKVKIGEIESRDGRSSLPFELEDGEYSARGRLDLTALYYLMTNASTTKSGRAKRGPVTITRARRGVTSGAR